MKTILIAACALWIHAAAAQFPERPIRLIVPQATGSATDNVSRLVAPGIARFLGQPVVVENRPGGALTIGIDAVAKSASDGYTLGQGPNGSPGHVSGELFKHMSGTEIVHIPYKGSAAAITDLIAGTVQLMFESTNSIAAYVKGGRGRALAVTGPRLASSLPEVPTLIEAGVPGYEVAVWSRIIAPAGRPGLVLDRRNAAVNAAIADPAAKERLAQLGSESGGGTPEDFAALTRRDSAKWAEVVRRSGATID